MTDIIGRLMSMGKLGPEMVLQLLGMVIDSIGQGEEWTGENLAELGKLTEKLADTVKGVQAKPQP